MSLCRHAQLLFLGNISTSSSQCAYSIYNQMLSSPMMHPEIAFETNIMLKCACSFSNNFSLH